VAYGSDPNDDTDGLPPEVFYVILPYMDDNHEYRDLDFSTDIQFADILFLVDLSGSMIGEHDNLKAGINNIIIAGVNDEISSAGFGLVKFGCWDDWDDAYELTQPITLNSSAVQAAVNTITDCGGSDEIHNEALWQAATGAGFDQDGYYIPPVSCGGQVGDEGGACFRDLALPIFIMISDEDFISGEGHSLSQAITAMNNLGAKFIGVDSGDAMGDYNTISNGTGSLDQFSQPFNFDINSDGTGMSSAIVDAIIELTQNIELSSVTTERESVTNPYSIDTTNFIKAITPIAADPPSGVDSFDATSFYGVDPGTMVTFNVDFYNDFFEPPSGTVELFEATIYVFGSGTQLDTREVYIIVPPIPPID